MSNFGSASTPLMGSAALNPIANASTWHVFYLGGVVSPGTIPRDGIRGFERETGWDRKKGKGTQGATLTLTTEPPCEGSITCQLFTQADFAQWAAMLQVLKTPAAKQKSNGIGIYHPSLADVDLNSVVVHKFSPPRHMGRGVYLVTIDFIEWLPPPPVSIVSTPTTSTVADPDPGEQQETARENAQQALISVLLPEASAP